MPKTKRKNKPAPVQQPLVGVPEETYELLKRRVAELQLGVLAGYMMLAEYRERVHIPHALETEKYLERMVTKLDIKLAKEVRKFYPPSFHGSVEHANPMKPEGVPQALSGTPNVTTIQGGDGIA